MDIPFVGGCYLFRSRNLNSQQSQNLYPVVDREDGKSVLSLRGVPGLTVWVNLGSQGKYMISLTGGLGFSGGQA